MATDAPDPVTAELLALLPRSPDVYPQKIDVVSMSVLLLDLNSRIYRAASFLDDRILNPQLKGAWVPIDRVISIADSVAGSRPLHFIFHTGHVGSTLVSRLLDETGRVLSLREPLPLRTFAEIHDSLGAVDSLVNEQQFDLMLGSFMRLWSRSYGPEQNVVVKATSSAGRLAVPILARDERCRAVYLNLRPEPYLAALLAGENSIFDLRGHGPERMRRLQSHLSSPSAGRLHEMSPGQLAALSWLAETWSQLNASRRYGERVLTVDFDVFLTRLEESLERIMTYFGLSGDAGRAGDLARSPVLTRYSKAPEYPYTPSDRARMLQESRSRNRGEIGKGMDWLERLAKSDGAVAELISAAHQMGDRP